MSVSKLSIARYHLILRCSPKMSCCAGSMQVKVLLCLPNQPTLTICALSQILTAARQTSGGVSWVCDGGYIGWNRERGPHPSPSVSPCQTATQALLLSHLYSVNLPLARIYPRFQDWAGNLIKWIKRNDLWQQKTSGVKSYPTVQGADESGSLIVRIQLDIGCQREKCPPAME